MADDFDISIRAREQTKQTKYTAWAVTFVLFTFCVTLFGYCSIKQIYPDPPERPAPIVPVITPPKLIVSCFVSEPKIEDQNGSSK